MRPLITLSRSSGLNCMDVLIVRREVSGVDMVGQELRLDSWRPDLVLFNLMVEYQSDLDATFGALSHPVRRHMLDALREAPMRVTELAELFTVSLAASSKHIRLLEHSGMVTRTVFGRDHVIRLDGRPLVSAGQWIETYRQFWEARLDALDDHLRGSRR